MDLSPFQLVSAKFTEVSVRATPPQEMARLACPQISMQAVYGKYRRPIEGKPTWNIHLFVSLTASEKEPVVYEGELAVFGLFTIEGVESEDEQAKWVVRNGSAILLGMIREMISNVSSRSAHGELNIPLAKLTKLEAHRNDLTEDEESESAVLTNT